MTHLNVISLPGLTPEHQSWNTGEETSEDTTEDSGLVEALCVPVDEAWLTARSTHTDTAVSAAVTQTLLPTNGHL